MKNFSCVIVVIVVFLFLLLSPFQINAGVYQCIKENGEIEFRDHACQPLEEQRFLPYVYHKTDPKVVKAQAKEIQKTKKRLDTNDKRTKRLNVRLSKKAEKEKTKALRKAERCKRTREKIKIIENRLRAGCKINQHNRLKEELIYLEKMEQKYCHG